MSTTNSLYAACQNNGKVRVRQLLQTLSKDELNEQGPNNRTALHAAAMYGHTEVLELLLEHEDINQSIKNQ
jgi:ankyrin repeat protein